MNPYVRKARPATEVTWPGTSTRRGVGSLDSERRRTPKRRQAAPTGTLMKKTHRQPTPTTSAPPTVGPIPRAIPLIADQSEIARTRSPAFENAVARIAKLVGASAAPPTPCSTRAASSVGPETEQPQSNDPSVKIAIPAAKNRRRPYR